MANQYGVANTPLTATLTSTIGAADVSCPSATETNVVAQILKGSDTSGFYYPEAIGVLVLVLGATPPGGITIAMRIGAGADIQSFSIAPTLLVASATLMIPIGLVAVASQVPWQGAGSTLNLTVNPTTQAVTAKFATTAVVMRLVRATDQ